MNELVKFGYHTRTLKDSNNYFKSVKTSHKKEQVELLNVDDGTNIKTPSRHKLNSDESLYVSHALSKIEMYKIITIGLFLLVGFIIFNL